MPSILEPFALGPLQLSNRVVMGPMTRARCPDDGIPTMLNAEFYAQRASAGLIVSEGVWPEQCARGYFATPGIETEAQAEGWKLVTDAVHSRGGRIFMQLMHCGRAGHPLNSGGFETVAPSAVQPDFHIFTREEGMVRQAMPRSLETDEVDAVLDRFTAAARRAKDANFDGIELHAASGYLPNQFLATNTNRRTDKWGGSPQKRCRFVIEAMDRLMSVFGNERTAIKLAPGIRYNDVDDQEIEPTYDHLVRHLAPLQPAYLSFQTKLSYEHLNDVSAVSSTEGLVDVWKHWPYEFMRERFSGPIMAAGDLTLDLAQRTLDAEMADLFVFGRRFVANPDLVERFRAGAALNQPDMTTIYSGGAAGYTDYPSMAAEPA